MPRCQYYVQLIILYLLAVIPVGSLFGETLRYRGRSGLPGSGKQVVLVSGDEEYRSEETVVQFARILAFRHGFDCTVLFAIDPDSGEIDPTCQTNIPGLAALEKADVLVLAVRFRNLPDEQMEQIDAYLKAGKPVLGIRTSTHAFQIPKDRKFARYDFQYDDQGGSWQQGFGRRVLGETWIAHHGDHGREATRGVIAPGKERHPIVRGCKDLFGPTDVYRIRLPLPGDSDVLVLGRVLEGMKPEDRPVQNEKNEPMMPLAWTKSYKIDPQGHEGKAFTSTIGSSRDFQSEGVRRLLVNAVYWLAGLEQLIPEQSQVDLIGEYKPLPMGFGRFEKGKKPSDFRMDENARF